MRFAFIAILIPLSGGLAAADPLAAVLNAEASGPLYTYNMVYETDEITATGQVDPSQPAGQRITVTSPAEADWPKGFAKALAEMDKEADGNIWCAQFAEMIPADAAHIGTEEGIATYQFVPKGDPDDKDEQKLMKNLVATAEIDAAAPAILSFHMTAPKPFKPVMVARVTTFDMKVDCAKAPDGRTYAAAMQMQVKGSAMMQSFEERNIQRITGLRALD